MSWATEIAKLRRDMVAQVDLALARIFGWTLTSSSSPMGDKDSVQTGDEPDKSGQQGQRPVRRIEPWGLRGRPPAKVRSLWVRLGSSNVLFLGIAPTKAYGPDNLEEGESQVYCSAGGTRVFLDKDGNVKIDAASGKDVIVNGGSKKVARRTDPVRVGTLAGANGAGAVTFTFQPLDADGLPSGPPVVGSTVTVTGVIRDGATNFKG